MSARLHIFVASADVTAPHHVIHPAEDGQPPSADFYFGPGQSKLQFHCLPDFDEQIRALVLAKAEFGEALARHEARPLVPLPDDAGLAPNPEPALLLDPDCRDGKHQSCVGGPCMCGCHEPAWAVPDAPVMTDDGQRDLSRDVQDVPLPGLPRRAPLEAPVGEAVCGARGPKTGDVCTASPHGEGDHATYNADGSVRKQWAGSP